MAESSVGSTLLFVGTFCMPNPPDHEGLHVFRVNPNDGTIVPVSSYVTGLNVGSFAIDEKRKILYVIDEVASNADFRNQHGTSGGGGGRVYAFSINFESGALSLLQSVPSYGTQPAGIALDASGSFLIVSHFTSRTTTTVVVGSPQSGYRIEPRFDDTTTVLFPLKDDGRIGDPVDVHFHSDSPSSPPSCLHSVTASPDGSFFVECDMRKDKLITFSIDTSASSLELLEKYGSCQGKGPRYCVFHPSLPIFYVNYEYQPLIEGFEYSKGGSFKSIGGFKVLPDDFENIEGALLSDLRVHPSGNFLFTLARGPNVVCVLSVEHSSGALNLIQVEQLGGLSPKGCAVSTDGRFLYIAMSVSNKVQAWAIGENGKLTATDQVMPVPRPSAIAIVRGSS